MSDDAELVGEGGFRVDRERALEKLKDFQVHAARWGVLNWFRLACALGARKATVTRSVDTFTFECDGASLPERALGDPFGGLLEGAGGPRERWLAYAALAAARADIEIELVPARGLKVRGRAAAASARAGLRRFLDVDYREALALSGLEIEVRVGSSAGRERLRGVTPLSIDFAGRFGIVDSNRHRFKGADGLRGELWIPMSSRLAPRPVELHHFGVRVGSTAFGPMPVPFNARVNCDAVSLDASLSSPVFDAAWRALAAGVGQEALVFLERVVARRSDDGLVLRWLRDTAARAAAPEAGDAARPVLERLRSAVVAYAPGGRAYTLRELDRLAAAGRKPAVLPESPEAARWLDARYGAKGWKRGG